MSRVPPLYLLAYGVAGREPDPLPELWVMSSCLRNWLGLEDDGEEVWLAEAFRSAAGLSPTAQGLRALCLYLEESRYIDLNYTDGISVAAQAGNYVTLRYLLDTMPTTIEVDWVRVFKDITDYRCFRACLDYYNDKLGGAESILDFYVRVNIDACRVLGGFELDQVVMGKWNAVMEAYGRRGMVPPHPFDVDYLNNKGYRRGLLITGRDSIKLRQANFDVSTFLNICAEHGHEDKIDALLNATNVCPGLLAEVAWRAAAAGRDGLFHRFYRRDSTYCPQFDLITKRLPRRFYRYLPKTNINLWLLFSDAILYGNLPLVRFLLQDRPPHWEFLVLVPVPADVQMYTTIVNAGIEVKTSSVHLAGHPRLAAYLNAA